ncbi:hypothetical protein C0030_005985 [Candidatus Liberibacter solanacearum]|uniref:Uncharacterized protein n=1 Tax=Candidatus Liberibacter solanacearum TaxID=556287 RepID=A0A3R7Q3A3_9HYPH|nr:hypothetical protein [Candidatus Liberibacter solanacearum]RPD36768.1 hypothetical protein C0030_005985 [Candidatus Liberibacter solanacearum]
MSVENVILREILKHFLEGGTAFHMVSHLRGNKKSANVLNNLSYACWIWFLRIVGLGSLYAVLYRLYQGQYPPSSIIIFLVIPWLSLSLLSATWIAYKEGVEDRKEEEKQKEQKKKEKSIDLENSFNMCHFLKDARGFCVNYPSYDKKLDEDYPLYQHIEFIEEVLKAHGIPQLSHYVRCNKKDNYSDVQKYLNHVDFLLRLMMSELLDRAIDARLEYNRSNTKLRSAPM